MTLTGGKPATDVREAFLDAFAEAGFRRSAPLSLLQPSIKTSFLFSVGFVDVIAAVAGQTPELDGAATVQRCFRHFDMDRAGDGRHLSFFEMAGALESSGWRVADLVTPLVRFLTRDCGIGHGRLHATYFRGGRVAGQTRPSDDEAREAYRAAGFPENRIHGGGPSTNIWFEGANSGTPRSGICGPHSEIFVALDGDGGGPLVDPDRYLEVSNVVTITHHARPGGHGIDPLPRPLAELAVGMERLEALCAGASDVHCSPKLSAVRGALMEAGARAEVHSLDLRVVTDHVRAATHLLADGGRPGNKGRPNVVRRLIRRLFVAAEAIELDVRASYPRLARVVAAVDGGINPNLAGNLDNVIEAFDHEAHRRERARRL